MMSSNSDDQCADKNSKICHSIANTSNSEENNVLLSARSVTNNNNDRLAKLPVVLLKINSSIPLGETTIKFLLRYAKTCGGFDKSLASSIEITLLNSDLEAEL